MLLTNKIFRITETVKEVYGGLRMVMDESGFNNLIPQEIIDEIYTLEVIKTGTFNFGLEEAQNFRCFEHDLEPSNCLVNYTLKHSLKEVVKNHQKWDLESTKTYKDLDGKTILTLKLEGNIDGEVAYRQILKGSQNWEEDIRFKVFTNYLGEGKWAQKVY